MRVSDRPSSRHLHVLRYEAHHILVQVNQPHLQRAVKAHRWCQFSRMRDADVHATVMQSTHVQCVPRLGYLLDQFKACDFSGYHLAISTSSAVPSVSATTSHTASTTPSM